MIAVRCSFLLASVAYLAVSVLAAADDETLARAKDLYRSAAYDEALVVLDEIAKDLSATDRVEASEYRLFCLIALDQKVEARTAIESMVNADPLYQLSTDQASPRVRTMFKDIRQSLLPGIVQREYAEAKAAFDRKDPQSTAQFERVLTLLADPIVASTPSFVDLRTVASGFRDLSKALAQPVAPPPQVATPPVIAAPPPVAAAPPVATNAAASAPATTPAVYRESDAEVVPPVTLKQAVPQWVIPNGVRPGDWQFEGILEVVIDEKGDVVGATLRKPFHPSFDAQLIKAAMSWKYEPARRGGEPVRFLKNVAIRVSPN